MQAHDAQVAASGITTVFDALRVGMDEQADMDHAEMLRLAEAIEDAKASGRLRADHFVHLRCEVSAPDCLEGFELLRGDGLVRLASLMDHAPGQRQFASLEAYRVYYQGKLKMSDESAGGVFGAPHRRVARPIRRRTGGPLSDVLPRPRHRAGQP